MNKWTLDIKWKIFHQAVTWEQEGEVRLCADNYWVTDSKFVNKQGIRKKSNVYLDSLYLSTYNTIKYDLCPPFPTVDYDVYVLSHLRNLLKCCWCDTVIEWLLLPPLQQPHLGADVCPLSIGHKPWVHTYCPWKQYLQLYKTSHSRRQTLVVYCF